MSPDRMLRWTLAALLVAGLVALAGCGAQTDTEADRGGEAAAEGGEAGRADASAPAAPAPQMVAVRVPAGTVMEVELQDDLSSGVNLAGDSFRAKLLNDIAAEGRVAMPSGSALTGVLDEVVSVRAKKIGGKAKMSMTFNRVDTPGGPVDIAAYLSETGKSETKKDAATIGGAAAVGALLGREIEDDDKTKGGTIGAIVGAAAGTAIAAKTEGKELEIPAGTVLVIELASPVDVSVRAQ